MRRGHPGLGLPRDGTLYFATSDSARLYAVNADTGAEIVSRE